MERPDPDFADDNVIERGTVKFKVDTILFCTMLPGTSAFLLDYRLD